MTPVGWLVAALALGVGMLVGALLLRRRAKQEVVSRTLVPHRTRQVITALQSGAVVVRRDRRAAFSNHSASALGIARPDGALHAGVADLAELARWRANAYAVLYDAGGVAEVMADIADTSPPSAADDGARDVRLVLTELLIGVGRARRGELLSAGDIIRSGAVGHLLSAVSMRIPATLEARLDNLDPRRRFETAYPAIAARIEVALTRPPEDCARALLACVEDVLAPGWPDFPHPGVAAVRARLGWD